MGKYIEVLEQIKDVVGEDSFDSKMVNDLLPEINLRKCSDFLRYAYRKGKLKKVGQFTYRFPKEGETVVYRHREKKKDYDLLTPHYLGNLAYVAQTQQREREHDRLIKKEIKKVKTQLIGAANEGKFSLDYEILEPSLTAELIQKFKNKGFLVSQTDAFFIHFTW
jgi:hypothetical protein